MTVQASAASAGVPYSPSFSRTVIALTLAFIATGMPILGHLAGQPIGIAMCAALGLLVALLAPATLPVVLVFSYLFQNLLVAVVSPEIADPADFKAIRVIILFSRQRLGWL
jgi:hypothetical protein